VLVVSGIGADAEERRGQRDRTGAYFPPGRKAAPRSEGRHFAKSNCCLFPASAFFDGLEELLGPLIR
jgi:hypothetical protein